MGSNYRFKLIIIGDTGTGKSCIVKQFTEPNYSFENIHDITIGVDFSTKITDIKIDNKTYKVKTQIWDTAGQEVFRSITSSYYRNSAAILLVFDLSNRYSFLKLDYWSEQINKNANHNPPIFLVGNKSDLLNRRVATSEAVSFAQNNNMIYIETSAKDNDKVNSLFDEVNRVVLEKVLSSNEQIEGVYQDLVRDYSVGNIEDSVNDHGCDECCIIS